MKVQGRCYEGEALERHRTLSILKHNLDMKDPFLFFFLKGFEQDLKYHCIVFKDLLEA